MTQPLAPELAAPIAAPSPAGPSERWPTVRLSALFLLAAWAAVLLNTCRLLGLVPIDGPLPWTWAVTTLVTYTAMYLLPIAAPTLAWAWLLDRRGPASRRARALLVGGAAAVVGAEQVVLFTDVLVYGQHGFHMNAFVWNVLRTPGGIASMGGGSATEASAAAISLAIVTAHVGLAVLVGLAVRRGPTTLRALPAKVTLRRGAALLAVLVALGLLERVTYAVADLRGHRPLTALGGLVPFYKPMTMRILGRRLGLEAAPRGPSMRLASDKGDGTLDYPKAPITFRKNAPSYNVVWLVGESLRADMVDPAIMPNTHAFAKKGQWFRDHQSGGNGTRMGMFSMFYGLYGSYWFPFKAARRQPLVVETILDRGYRVEARTSALFSYPEFNETIWSQFPRDRMFTLETEVQDGWTRDEEHVKQMLAFMDQDPSKPFFTFMFFESTHAMYGFPPETAIRPDYITDFNYATTDIPASIHRIKDRYVNAAHWLDVILGRLFDHLTEKGLLERTIVVVTGDHGEEFLEHGRWGHNSTFSKEQISPPLILWVPGAAPAEHHTLSSHLDIAPTVLRALGCTNPIEEVSLGHDLLGPVQRSYNVVSDWYSVVYSDDHDRAIFRLDSVGRPEVFHDDVVVDDPAPFLAAHQAQLLEIMKGLRTFADPRH